MSDWNYTRNGNPKSGTAVLAVHLYRFANAPWRWSTPEVLTFTEGIGWYAHGDSYGAPEIWQYIDLPEIPK